MLNNLLNPKSIAIIGAAREKEKVGRVILDNVIKAGYKGRIYPVNPRADEIAGLKSYPSINDINGPIDLVVIVTPAKTIPMIIEDCGRKGIKAAIIISAGFKETGLDGSHLEKKVVRIAKSHNMRILGPNCLGLINAHIGLNASFTRVGPLKGNIAFISQSGALQTAILDWSRKIGIGFSKFISLGNKADLNEADFLQALADDDRTAAICLYLEGVSEGSRFLNVAAKIALKKPIISLKAGRTDAGARAVSSHTGTLAGSSKAYTAAFTQTGIIQADSLEQLFSYAIVLSSQPLPKGNRLAIVTNAGGPAILASDYATESALTVNSLTNKTIEKLSSFLPAAASVYNPVDLLGDALADRYENTLSIVEKDPGVDNILVILTPQAMTEIEKTAELVVRIASQTDKPLITAFMGGGEIEKAEQILRQNDIPNYIYPEDAVRAIGSLVTYSKIKKRPLSRYKRFKVNEKVVRRIINGAKQQQRVNLSYVEANNIIAAYGIKVPKSFLAIYADQAITEANKIGYPIALKIISPDILHKTDIGGVEIDIQTPDKAADAFENIMRNARRFMPQADIQGVLIQEMVEDGQETIVGVSRDPQFGPLILFGLGGIYVEVLKDVAFRIAPVSIMDVKKMLGEVKSYMLLKGIRGKEARDIEAIEEVILRVSQLVTDFKEIVEMDINPLMVKNEGEGAVAADVRMSISL